MNQSKINKRKIINDPVYGFISIPNSLVFDIIEHPFFQRLRRIKQLGLTHLVYPGALHTRFQHAIGAMHLMCNAIDVLRYKGLDISPEEEEASVIAILLHDIGHGPFSHSLENSIVDNITHEVISEFFMTALNKHFQNKMSLAIKIYKNTYNKKFLHQLVSSQLDMDRLDYLNRDSYFTGVSEGVIGSERIIKMLNVQNDELVVDAKGVYSIEKFVLARSLMYWQVYLHKTVVSAEYLLIHILRRAKELVQQGKEVFCTPALGVFMKNTFNQKSFLKNNKTLEQFALLDDYDIYTSIKVWCNSSDNILSMLSQRLINRQLFKIEYQNTPFNTDYINKIKEKTIKNTGIKDDEVQYFVYTDSISNSIYSQSSDKIKILFKNDMLLDITEASDQLDKEVLNKTIIKYFLCYPKDV